MNSKTITSNNSRNNLIVAGYPLRGNHQYNLFLINVGPVISFIGRYHEEENVGALTTIENFMRSQRKAEWKQTKIEVEWHWQGNV